MLNLSNPNNAYNGPTIIQEGVLLSPSPYSNIQLNGGVLGLNANFTRNIGTGAGTIRWTGSGGFAAYGGDRIVELNDSPLVIWGDTNYEFVQTGQELRFGHYTATGTVIFHAGLELGAYQNRTIRVERGRDLSRADVAFTLPISGWGSALTIKGSGRMDILSNAAGWIGIDLGDVYLHPELHILGTEVRFANQAKLGSSFVPWDNKIFIITIKNGGALTLDNTSEYVYRRLMKPYVSLNGGTLRLFGKGYRGLDKNLGIINEETISFLRLEGGANTLYLEQEIGTNLLDTTALFVDGFSRNEFATLDYQRSGGQKIHIIAQKDINFVAINDFGGDAIIPWATVNEGSYWATTTPAVLSQEIGYLTDYHTSTDQNTWNASRNLSLTSTQTLSGNRTINSLRLGNVALRTSTHTLTINSGGLLTYTGNPRFENTGTIKTASNRPLYAHIYSNSLNIYGGNVGFDVPSLIKTGPGTLIFESGKTQKFPNLYIHQGTVEIRNPSTIQASNIYIGDGAGRDILILPKDRIDPLINKPSITLRGTPYGLDPNNIYGGAESDQAILRLSGNTKQHINELIIQERGTIDFAGGDAGLANILWIDILRLTNANGADDPTARLFIRNWYQYEDYLLVRKVNPFTGQAFNKALLSRIIFDGYQDFPVLAVDYDSQYYQIPPFHAPEPATYGAILGSVGIGLVAWRKRKRRGLELASRQSQGGLRCLSKVSAT